jgi:hypothetical protein
VLKSDRLWKIQVESVEIWKICEIDNWKKIFTRQKGNLSKEKSKVIERGFFQ